MLLNGIFLGGITVAGLIVVYKRLPNGIQAIICRHPLLTDVICIYFFYSLMGMSLVAHVAVAFMTLTTQVLLHVERRKEDYQFLYDIVDTAKLRFREAMDGFRQSVKKFNNESRQIIDVS